MHSSLKEFQRNLYQRAFADAQRCVSVNAPHFFDYEKEFAKLLPSLFVRIDEQAIVRDIGRSRVMLYGDFHTLPESQKGYLRLCRQVAATYPKKRVVLALEMFRACDQGAIERYLGGDIDDTTLLRLVDYEKNWGFPWENFRAILGLARANQWEVVGINTAAAGRDSLEQRDRLAAETLHEIWQDDQDAIVMTLIGEYHLADSFLPQRMAEVFPNEFRATRLVNNIDKYFFHDAVANDAGLTQHLRIGRSLFCVMNCPPWMKWQSLANWEEQRQFGHPQETLDADFQFLTLLRALTSYLQVGDIAARQDFYIVRDTERWLSQQDPAKLASHPEWIRAALDERGVFYERTTRTVLLARFSFDNVAHACGQYLYATLNENRDQGTPISERLLASIAGCLAAKVLNPRVRLQQSSVHLSILADAKGRRLLGSNWTSRQTSRCLLALYKTFLQSVPRGLSMLNLPESQQDDTALLGGVSSRLGEAIAAEVYAAQSRSSVATRPILRFFHSPSHLPEIALNILFRYL